MADVAVCAVLMTYARRGNEDVRPSQQEIADRFKVSPDTVQRCERKLIELGYITTTRERRGDGRLGRRVCHLGVIFAMVSATVSTARAKTEIPSPTPHAAPMRYGVTAKSDVLYVRSSSTTPHTSGIIKNIPSGVSKKQHTNASAVDVVFSSGNPETPKPDIAPAIGLGLTEPAVWKIVKLAVRDGALSPDRVSIAVRRAADAVAEYSKRVEIRSLGGTFTRALVEGWEPPAPKAVAPSDLGERSPRLVAAPRPVDPRQPTDEERQRFRAMAEKQLDQSGRRWTQDDRSSLAWSLWRAALRSGEIPCEMPSEKERSS